MALLATALVLPALTATSAGAAGEIVFVDASSTAGNRSAHAVTVPRAVEPGDVLVLALTTNSTATTVDDTVPGWDLIRSRDGSGIRGRLWARTATAADAGSTVSVTTSGYAKSVLTVGAYRSTGGTASVSASALTGADSSGTTHTTPEVPVAGAGSWLVNVWAEKSSSDQTWLLPASTTQRSQGAATGSGKISAVWADSAGAVPEGTAAGRTATTSSNASRTNLFSIVITPGDAVNAAPDAAFTALCDGLACTFDASGSSDPEGADLTHGWDFGDGTTGAGAITEHTYADGGPRTVTLTVSDGDQSAVATRAISPDVAVANGEVDFVGAASTAGNRTAHTVVVPTAVRAGDVLVLALTTNSTSTTIADSVAGWNLLEARDGNGIRGRLWSRVAAEGDAGSTVRVNTSAASKSVLSIGAYRGDGQAPAVSASAVGGTNSSTSSHTTPAVPIGTPGSWLVSMWSGKTSGSPTWTVPGTVTPRDAASAGGSGRITATWGDSAVPVPVGTASGRTATTSAALSRSVHFSVVVSPGVVVNQSPVAAFSASCAELVCAFDASATTDPEGDDLTYAWDFGDGRSGTGESTEHTYATAGPRTATLTVSDGLESDQTTREVDPREAVTPGEIEFVGATSTAGNRPAHSVTVPTSVVAGDRLVLFLVTNSTATTIDDTVPGWELIESRDGTGLRGRAWTRSATPADPGSIVNVPGSGYAKSVMSLAAYRSTGTAAVSASAVGGSNSPTTQHATPATTADNGNPWLVSVWSEKSSGDPAWTLPGSVTQRTADAAAGNGKVSAVLADSATAVPIGAVPSRTATTAVSGRSVTLSVVIAPGTDATGTNEPPVAEFETGCAGLTCEFDAAHSFDLDGDDLTYAWDFGDGRSGTGVNAEHTYASPGARTVTLTVDDGNGHTDTATSTATAAAPNPPPGHTTLVPDAPRTNQPTITDGEIWDIEVVGNRVYVAGSFTSIRQPNNGTIINQAGLAAYNWNTGQVDTGFRPVFANGGVTAVETTPDGSKLFVSGDFGTVNGLNHKAIARLDPTTGAPIGSFVANGNGKVFELAVTNNTVYAGGRFTTINNVPRGALAALDAETGAVRPDFVNNITGGIGTNGELAVQRLKLTYDEGRLLVVHTGRQVNGQDRYGVAIINTRTGDLTPWKTTLWEDNLQFVGGIQRIYGGDIAPDDSYFVVSSGSGGDRPPINDTVIRFELDHDPDAQPTWIARHFDSVYSVTATEAGIYIGGHFQWAESATAPVPWPGLDDQGYGTGQGLSGYALGDAVVKRFHLAALDPEKGHGLEWFAASNSYEGDKHIEATPRGLFVGGDGNTKGGYNVGRIAFFDFNTVPAQNGTRTEITDPIEGRIRPVGEEFEITGTASAASGIQRVEVEIMDRNSGRYLNDDLTTWGGTSLNTFDATLDEGTGTDRTWRVPITMTANRELQVRARAVAGTGTADNTKAAKKFETFSLADQPPDANVTGPGSPVNAMTFTITGSATDDFGVNSVSLTLRDTQGRYLQDDGTVSGTYNTFPVTPDVVGATSTTWSHEVTLPFEDEWWAQARATDTAGQTSLDTGDRRWIVTENGQPPTVSITQPALMVPPTPAQPVTVAPGSPITFAGSATDDEALREVSITLRNTTTGERLASDGTWGTNIPSGSYRVSPIGLNQPAYNWTYTTPFNLTPGTYSFTVNAEDHIGLRTSSSNRGSLTVVAQYPGDDPPDGRLDVTGTVTGGQVLHLDLSGTATDDHGVAQVKVALEENDTSRYLQPGGALSATFNTLGATLASPGATSTTWTLPVDLPVEGDWRVTVYAVDTVGQQDTSTSGATARYEIYPGDQPPLLTEGLLNPLEGTEFSDGKIFVSGRAEDDQRMDEVEVGIVNEAGQYMSSSGNFTSTNASWRTAFLTSPGTPGSNFSYTTPVIPPGAYTVRVRAIDHHGFTSAISERHVTVTHPPNDPPVASFTVACVENVCSFDARGSTDENATTLTYSWNFGNGSGSGPVPTRTYSSANTYTVVLTARDEWGVTATASQTVTITEPPDNQAPVAVINPPACAGLSCNFSSVGSGDPDVGDSITRQWDWGDGTNGSTSTSTSHAFPAAGTYTVTLTITDGWGSATTTTREVTVSEP